MNPWQMFLSESDSERELQAEAMQTALDEWDGRPTDENGDPIETADELMERAA